MNARTFTTPVAIRLLANGQPDVLDPCIDKTNELRVRWRDPITTAALQADCSADMLTYAVNFTIVGGEGPFVLSAGGTGGFDPADARNFSASGITAGQPYSFSFTDSESCTLLVSAPAPSCSDDCPGYVAGTFSGIVTGLCDPFTSDLGFENNAVLDGGTLQFLVYADAAGSSLLGRANSLPINLGLFGAAGETLYVTSVVGPVDALGDVELMDECSDRGLLLPIMLGAEGNRIVREDLCVGDFRVVGGVRFDVDNPTGTVEVDGVGGSCDSVITVALSFIPGGDTLSFTPTLCPSMSPTYGGRDFSIDNPSDTFQVGTPTCFTTYFVDINYLSSGRNLITETLCIGEELRVVDEVFNASRPSGRVQTIATNTCDSIIDVDLTFIPRAEVALAGEPELCNPEEVTVQVTVSGDRAVNSVPFINGSPAPGVLLTPGSNELTFPANGPFALVVRDLETAGPGCNAPNVPNLSYNPRISRLDATIVEPLSGYATCGNNTIDFVSVQTGDGAAPYEYAWSTGATTNAINDVSAGTYTALVRDALGCEDDATVTISEIDTVDYVASLISPTCEGGTGSISISLDEIPDNAEYRFDLPGLNPLDQADFTFDDLAAGTYVFQIKQGGGCEQSRLLTLNEPPTINLIKDDSTSIALGDTVSLIAQVEVLNGAFAWTPSTAVLCPSCPNTTAAPIETITYIAEATTNEGCVVTDRLYVEVRPLAELYVPTAFSPNGDGINDVLLPYGGNAVSRILTFQVFDRWGELLYEANDFNAGDETAGWTGRRGDEDELMPGVYVVLAEAEFLDGTRRTFTSDVTLLR